MFDTAKLLAADLIDAQGVATTAPGHNSITTEAEFRALIGVYAASNGQSATFTTVSPFDTSFTNGVQATVGSEAFEWNVGGHGADPAAGTGPHATRDGGGLSFTDDELAAMRTTTGTVTLTLKNAALSTDVVTFDYKTKKKDQTTGVIQDLAGNDLQSFKDADVSNITAADAITGLSAKAAFPSTIAESNGEVVVDGDDLLEVNRGLGLAANPDTDGSLFFPNAFGVDGQELIPPTSDILA